MRESPVSVIVWLVGFAIGGYIAWTMLESIFA